MLLPWLLCGILSLAVLALCCKLLLLGSSLEEIRTELGTCLNGDTNALISVSSRDRHVRRLAAALNIQLRLLRDQRRQYQSGDRALKEAVTNISHDLRTPLTAICGYLELLSREEKSPQVSRYLNFIENRTQALRQLTEELFRYSVAASSGEQLSLSDVSLNRALEEGAAAFYAVLKQRGIAPVIRMPGQQIVRRLNAAALSRIFGNILHNALKYSDGDLHISLLENGEILFSNAASRLDEVLVGKLFDRFFSVEAAGTSSGIGLAIARTLTERMHGSIDAQYRDGRLCIRLRFPA